MSSSRGREPSGLVGGRPGGPGRVRVRRSSRTGGGGPRSERCAGRPRGSETSCRTRVLRDESRRARRRSTAPRRPSPGVEERSSDRSRRRIRYSVPRAPTFGEARVSRRAGPIPRVGSSAFRGAGARVGVTRRTAVERGSRRVTSRERRAARVSACRSSTTARTRPSAATARRAAPAAVVMVAPMREIRIARIRATRRGAGRRSGRRSPRGGRRSGARRRASVRRLGARARRSRRVRRRGAGR